MHRRNAAERAIRTFKAHFISILAGVDLDFPSHLWDLLVPQAEMTQNLLRPCTSDPTISAWENFNGELDYNAKSLGANGNKSLNTQQTLPEEIMGHEGLGWMEHWH